MKLTTRKIDGRLVVEGVYLALKTFSQPDKPKRSKLGAILCLLTRKPTRS